MVWTNRSRWVQRGLAILCPCGVWCGFLGKSSRNKVASLSSAQERCSGSIPSSNNREKERNAALLSKRKERCGTVWLQQKPAQ